MEEPLNYGGEGGKSGLSHRCFPADSPIAAQGSILRGRSKGAS
jgi:hypothetical protein